MSGFHFGSSAFQSTSHFGSSAPAFSFSSSCSLYGSSAPATSTGLGSAPSNPSSSSSRFGFLPQPLHDPNPFQHLFSSSQTLFGSNPSSSPQFGSSSASASAPPSLLHFGETTTSFTPSTGSPLFGSSAPTTPAFPSFLSSSSAASVASSFASFSTSSGFSSFPSSATAKPTPTTTVPAFGYTTSATATTTTTGTSTPAAQTSAALVVASTSGTTSNVNLSTTVSTTTPKLPAEITEKTVEEMQAPTEAMPLTILASELPPPAFQQPPQAMETSAIATELPFEGIPTVIMGEGTDHISEINSTPMAPSTSATPFSTEAKTSEPCDVDQPFKGTCNEDLPPELQSATKQDAPVLEVEEMELIASPCEERATEALANSPPRAVMVTETNNGAAKSTSEPETLPLEVSTTCVRLETSESDDQSPKDNTSQLINKASEFDSTFSKTASEKGLTPESKLFLRIKLEELSLRKNSITQLTEEESKAFQLLREVTDTSFFDQRECQERVEAAVSCLLQRKMAYQWILLSIRKVLEELPQAFHSYDGLQKELADLSSQGLKIHEQQTQLHAQASEVQQANDSVDQKKARVTTLEEQVKALQAEINTLNAEIAIEEDKATDALVEAVTSLEEWYEKEAQHESEASLKQREVIKAKLHYKVLCTTIVAHIQNLLPYYNEPM